MKTSILGINIDTLTFSQALTKVESFFNPQSSILNHQIITANPEMVLEAWKNQDYRDLINRANLVVADGIGLLWAAKFLSLKSSSLIASLMQMIVSGISLIIYPKYSQDILPERIAGVDLMEKICQLASQKNWKVYLLGGEQGIAEQCANKLKNKYLNLEIVGAESGPTIQDTGYTIRDNNTEANNVIKNINESKADVLFIAMGAPKQEFLIKEILPQLPSVKLAMGVGGSFDFISGKVRRAPPIYRDLNIEWLFRLITQPWRLLRIFNATVRFIYNVVRFKHLANGREPSPTSR